jgi:hypothetical protein
MRPVYVFLITVSLMTQSMANPVLENSDAVPTAQPVVQSSVLTAQNVAWGLKHAGYYMAAIACLSMAKGIMDCKDLRGEERNSMFKNKVLLRFCGWALAALIGGIGSHVESKRQSQEELSQQNTLRNRMISAPVWGLVMTGASLFILNKIPYAGVSYYFVPIGLALSSLAYFAGATWSLKDWYQGRDDSRPVEGVSH